MARIVLAITTTSLEHTDASSRDAALKVITRTHGFVRLEVSQVGEVKLWAKCGLIRSAATVEFMVMGDDGRLKPNPELSRDVCNECDLIMGTGQ